MTAPSLLSALVQLRRLEKDAKEGEVSQDEAVERLGFEDDDKLECAKGTGMALLHLPAKTTMDLAWFAVTPALTAFLVFYGWTFAGFALFVVARLAIWAYDSALIYRGQRSDALPYNSSTLSTLMGTFPYRGNWLVGPGLTVALDIGVVLPFSGILGLGQLGLIGHAVEASAIAHALLTLVTRVGLNTACAVEQYGGADRKVVGGAATGLERVWAGLARIWTRIAELVGRFDETPPSENDPPPDAAGHYTRSDLPRSARAS